MIMCCVNDVNIEHVMPPSDEKRLKEILLRLDESIIPKLSERVDLDEYAEKLSERAELFYAIRQGKDIGNCAIYLNSGSYGYISSIAVTKEGQDSGIGTQLWNYVLKRAIEKKIKLITLMVYETNSKAIAFYKRNGFYIIEKSQGWIKMQFEVEEI